MTRVAKDSKPVDQQGQIPRQLGWKTTAAGKRVQHKFRLGSDPKEAAHRERRLCDFWDRIVESSPENPLWDEFTLDAAKLLAKGAVVVWIDRRDGEPELDYACRVAQSQNRYPGFFAASDVTALQQGVADSQPLVLHIPRPDSIKPDTTGVTLHDAMSVYIDWINEEYFDPRLDRVTDNGHTKMRQVKTLMSRHKDVPLSSIDVDYLESMFRYWRRRPSSNRRTTETEPKRVTKKSAQNYIGELKRFFRWLHRSRAFSWRKPEDLDEINCSVDSDPVADQKRLVQANVFTLEELRLLNRYATPLERVLLLLGLNCAFGAAEISTLLIGEVFLNQGHEPDHQELLNYRSTNADSFIKRIRRKNNVYGEFLLFPQTAAAMQWQIARRLQQPNPAADQPLLLNDNNAPYNQRTVGGNQNQQIPNRFGDLIERIKDDGNAIQPLSFGKLRMTAADLIRRFSDGEVAGVFMCHGSAVKTDDLADVYTNRPFGKVFEAIRRVERHLQVVFEEAEPAPFKAGPQAYTGRKSIDQIAAMRRNGKSIREIAETVGKSRMTVQRHLAKLKEAGMFVD